jgi:phosphoribosylamine--glycine ligase
MVIGSGAREHALAARLASEPLVSEILCAPGNPGMMAIAQILPADLSRPESIVELATREHVDFTIVGPEAPLSLGIADHFARANRLLFGPSAAAARLESSKAFAKAFMERHAVPTARFRTCDHADEALACVRSGEFGFPVVLKADGLAAGKGVVIAATLPEAEMAIVSAMTDGRFGAAGARLVIEECLTGPEVSFFVISDGTQALPIGTAQDHKRIFDEDRGPNTGGMGAFAPSPLIDGPLHARILRDIVQPVISGMAAEGAPFRGFLYVGLMLTPAGPKVIEFNVRLGDPEAQVILPLIAEPLLPILIAAARGRLSQTHTRLTADKLVGVVLAAGGYPDAPESGRPISGIPEAERLTGVSVYHAGTAARKGQIVSAGGRVLTVVGRGPSYADAIARAYAGVAAISFDGMQFRRDIGRKVLDRG